MSYITHAQRMRSILTIAFAIVAVVLVAKPAQADFTPPNTPKLTKSVEVTAETGAAKGFYDAANGVIHVLGTETLTAYDATTLEVRAATYLNALDDETFAQFGNAFDPEHGVVFATKLKPSTNPQLQGWEFLPGDIEDPADDSYSPWDIDIPAYRTVVYSSELDRVYSIGSAVMEEVVEPSVAVATRNPDSHFWEAGPSYPSIAIGGANNAVKTVQSTSTGKLIGTYVPTVSGFGMEVELTRKPIYSFADTGSELVPTEIPGTQLDPATVTYSDAVSVGYSDFTPRAGGSMTATELSGGAPTRQVITLVPDAVDPSGFVVSPTSLALTFSPVFTASDVGSDLFFSTTDTVSLYRDGALLASSNAAPELQGLIGGNGRVYAITSASAQFKLSAMSVGAYSPTITTEPTPQSISVGSASEAKSVTLLSGATGTPSPTAQWQKQLAGQSAWNDISGATNPDLTFGATAADNGASYRAVYSNTAGEIATASAQLTVTVNAPAPTPLPLPLPLGPPDPAAPQVKNGKSVKLKFKKGKSARVSVGSVTCASLSTCVYTLPKTIKFKVGKKSFSAKIVGPASLEPGKSQTIYATVPAGAIKALKGKKSKLIVNVQVGNILGRMHDMTKSIISKISA